MKTFRDLMEIITVQTEKSEGMMKTFSFDINTRHNWVSMYSDVGIDIEGVDRVETLISNMSIDTAEQIQLAYWSIYSYGRK